MIKKAREIPSRFYQLALFNIALIIALSKQVSLLYIVSSLAFVTLVVSSIAIFLKLISPPPHQLISVEIKERINKLKGCARESIEKISKLQGDKQINFLSIGLLAIYVSLNFLCPCIETFILLNVVFVYFFLPSEMELVQSMIGDVCQGKCPVKH